MSLKERNKKIVEDAKKFSNYKQIGIFNLARRLSDKAIDRYGKSTVTVWEERNDEENNYIVSISPNLSRENIIFSTSKFEEIDEFLSKEQLGFKRKEA